MGKRKYAIGVDFGTESGRAVLVDVDLTGMLLGATLATKAPEIYRALIEATVFGTCVRADLC